MALSIDPMSDRAAYRQIADQLRTRIGQGELSAGDRLPSERALMDAYGAARGTVRQAIALLRNEGLVEVEQGRGVFVRRNPPVRRLASDRFARQHRQAGKAAFAAEVEGAGRHPEVDVLEVGPRPAPDEPAQRLRLATGDTVLVRRRSYLADGEPMELATSYVPWSFAEGTPMVDPNPGPGGIYARLEEAGHRLDHFNEEVAARMPSEEERRALRLVPGAPVITIVRTAYDHEGTPVEVCDTVLAADRYILSYELPAH